MKEVVIVSACRSAIGKFGGTLKPLTGKKIAAPIMKAALDRIKLDPNMLDDVRFGCCMERIDEMNVARAAAVSAGIPVEVPAVTINRVCDSGMEAIVSGAMFIKSGQMDIVLAGGVESMSNAPFLSFDTRWGVRYRNSNITFVDGLYQGLHAGFDIIMGLTAENLCEKYGLTREELDEVALRSHNNAENATKTGRFKDEIVPIEVPQRKGDPIIFDKDEHFRPGLTMNQLAKLPPAFKKGGLVTAGNSSGINDGAAALILMYKEKADELGLTPLARILGYGVAGVDPYYMGEGPVPATKKAFKNTGIQLKDIELIECNEAFAACYLVAEKQLGFDREIANVNGSGIGLGHPVGCTGARIVVTLIYEMIKRNLNIGLATLCGGGGLGMTLILQRD
ncbi:MAG: acetyl-CoA C-acetyltransferase [Candidatus Helarchaeota archaeon]